MSASDQVLCLAGSAPSWLDSGIDDSVVVSSRIRLARNLAETPFPAMLDPERRFELWRNAAERLRAEALLPQAIYLHMSDLGELEREIIFERHLISREQLEQGRGSGVIASGDESISLMVNEEDHFRLQCYAASLNIYSAWERLDAFDTAFARLFDYAFSDRFGYLSCCPSNLGTGLRSSVMLHLPALSLLDEIRPVVNGLSKIGLAVRGMWGEGSDVAGHMYQVSNQITLGKVEVEMVKQLGHIVRELSDHEKNARERLLERHTSLIRDYVGRARGVLENAYILSSKEAFDLLSALRLGIEAGLLRDIGRRAVDELFVLIQPAHLQASAGAVLNSAERDELRATRVRDLMETEEEKNGNNDE